MYSVIDRQTDREGRQKAHPATQNASQKSSGGNNNKEIRTKLTFFCFTGK